MDIETGKKTDNVYYAEFGKRNSVESTCSYCGFSNKEHSKHCANCSSSLFSESYNKKVETKYITILSCDLVKSTELSQLIDGEEFHHIISNYQKLCGKIIQTNEGFCGSFAGDGILAYFGYPHTSEKDAQNALKSAIEILEGVKKLSLNLYKTHGYELKVRIGLHSGYVTSGMMGSSDNPFPHSICGLEVNTAARISSAALPNQIFCSSSTKRHIEGYAYTSTLGQIELKDVHDLKELFEVKGLRLNQTRFAVSQSRGLTPMVGRGAELEVLLGAWNNMQVEQAQLISIVGEPGIGKSRLIHQFCNDGVEATFVHFHPEDKSKSLHAIRKIFKTLTGIHAKDDETQQKAKISELAKRVKLDSFTDTSILYELLEISLTEEQQKYVDSKADFLKNAAATVIKVLRLFSKEKPVVLVIEDYHWSDSSMEYFLEQFSEQTDNLVESDQVMILISSRDKIEASLKNHTEIKLNILGENEIEKMVSSLVPNSKKHEVRKLVIKKCGGNPLFIEELVSMMAAGDNFQAEDIPSGIIQLLSNKIEMLGCAKDVLKVASVLGNRFSFKHITRIVSWDTSRIQEEIELLIEEGILLRSLDSEDYYIFRHALLKEAAYKLVLGSEKKTYHSAAAHSLMEEGGENSQIAHHLSASQQYDKAVDYWLKSVDTSKPNATEFLECVERDYNKLSKVEKKVVFSNRQKEPLFEMYLKYCAVYGHKGTAAETYKYLMLAKEHMRPGDPHHEFSYMARYAIWLRATGKLEEAYEVYENCSKLLLSNVDALSSLRHEIVMMFSNAAYVSSMLGLQDECLDFFEYANYFANQDKSGALSIHVEGYLVTITHLDSEYNKTIELADKLIDQLEPTEYWFLWAKLLKAWALCKNGVQEGKQLILEAYEEYKPKHNAHALGHAKFVVADALFAMNEINSASEFVVGGLEACENGFKLFQPKILDLKAKMC